MTEQMKHNSSPNRALKALLFVGLIPFVFPVIAALGGGQNSGLQFCHALSWYNGPVGKGFLVLATLGACIFELKRLGKFEESRSAACRRGAFVLAVAATFFIAMLLSLNFIGDSMVKCAQYEHFSTS